jgi:integrase
MRLADTRSRTSSLLDSGVRRWRTIDGNLRAADTALRSVHHRQDRGERVVATTATLADVAAAYLAAQTEIRPRTREKYETGLRVHVLPRLGRRRIATITTDDVAAIVAAMRDEGRAGWTIRGVLVPLSRLFAYAVRRGYLAVNPVSALERSERPKVRKRPKRVLSADEIRRLLEAATPLYRPILMLAVYTGLRQSECLGLQWRDVDLEAGFVRVRAQLDRSGARVEPKTAEAVRDVVLAPSLGRMLRAHRVHRATPATATSCS